MARSTAPSPQTALVRVDPLADVPAYDPALDPANQLKPPLTPADAKQRLNEMAQELLTAPPARVAALTIEIQRVRVALLLLHEAETGESNPDTQRELDRLTKLLTGQDPGDGDTGSVEDLARRERAEATLRARNFSPETAARVLRVFTSLNSVKDKDKGGDRGRSESAH